MAKCGALPFGPQQLFLKPRGALRDGAQLASSARFLLGKSLPAALRVAPAGISLMTIGWDNPATPHVEKKSCCVPPGSARVPGAMKKVKTQKLFIEWGEGLGRLSDVIGEKLIREKLGKEGVDEVLINKFINMMKWKNMEMNEDGMMKAMKERFRGNVRWDEILGVDNGRGWAKETPEKATYIGRWEQDHDPVSGKYTGWTYKY